METQNIYVAWAYSCDARSAIFRCLSRVYSSTKHPRISDGQLEGVPCQLINCFCMYSDYVPMTLDEWIEIDKQRRNII